MKVTILVDNTAINDRYYRAEPGFSVWIEDGETRILFDCGYSEIIIQNAVSMGIDLLAADAIVFSHGHYDHTWGLYHLLDLITRSALVTGTSKKLRFVGHPASFWSRTNKGLPECGPIISPDRLSSFGDVVGTCESVYLTERVLFLGEIPSIHPFDQRKEYGTLFTPDGPVPDYIPDDSAIAMKTAEGLVIITGCAHAGICSVIRRAQVITGEDRIRDVIGGYHLYQSSPNTITHIASFLKNLNPVELHPCHCTGQLAKQAFSELLSLDETGVGTVLEYL
jgi:7,8-dihydropterin-6-yl-methyl-4-(beta-D-ribofuranosyl)aminobenzene 5'-phosphate synthase